MDEGGDDAVRGDIDAVPVTEADDRAVDRVHFGAPPGADILQHGRTICLGRLRDGADEIDGIARRGGTPSARMTVDASPMRRRTSAASSASAKRSPFGRFGERGQRH